jgi:hypothetical protein
MKSQLRNTLLALMLLSSASVHALAPIPDKNGISGFVSFGLGVADVESNFLAEAVGQDLGDKNISSLGSPEGESIGLPIAAFELSYVFNGKTQLYVGNLLEDYLRFDFTTRFGVRHNVGKAGRLGFSALQSPIVAKVWKDPYATGVDRESMDRDTTGFRVSWDEIFGSGLEVRFSSRELDLDDEESGNGVVGLTPTEIASLDRNGDFSQVNIRYELSKNETNRFILGVTSKEADLDGSAMNFDSTSIELDYIYTPSKDLKVVTILVVGSRDFDEGNPVFSGQKADSDFTAFTVSGFFPGLFGFKDWTANASLVIGQDDSDIDFFDQNISMLSFGFLHRF